jgi:hypothetical protein
MSLVGDAVARRLAQARAAGDAAPLTPPEALADALALLREATPGPEGDIDFAALADVYWTLALRMGSGHPVTAREAATARAALGFLHARAPGYISLPDLPAEMDGDPHWDARFAFFAAAAHGEFAQTTADLPRPERRSQVEIALAWAEQPRRAFGDDDPDVLLQRMSLLTSRCALAPDPGDLTTALTLARTLLGRLDAGNPGHVGPFQAVYEVLSMSALLLGDPTLAEAERVLGSAPAGTVTERAAGYVARLHALHAEPEEWPGQADLRTGATMAAEGIKSSDVFLLAFGIRRLRAALPAVPAGHAAGRQTANLLGAALLAFGELSGDPETRAEGTTFAVGLLDHFHSTLSAYAAERGAVLPTQVELGAILLEATASLGDRGTRVGVGSELMAAYRAALGRLPADDPDRDAFAAIAATPDSGRVAVSMLTVPWARLAVDIRATLPDGQPAQIAAGMFEQLASVAPAGGEQNSALVALAGLLNGDKQDEDAAIARLRADLAKADDGKVRGILTTVLATKLLSRSAKAGHRDAATEAVGLLLRANPRELPPQAAALLGLARLLDPLHSRDAQPLREETALLTSLPPGEQEPYQARLATIAEFMTRSLLLVEDLDVTQVGKIAELTQRLRDLVGQAGPQTAAAVGPQFDFADAYVQGVPGQLEAGALDGRAAQADAAHTAWIRERIETLPVGDAARDQLGAQLAMKLLTQVQSETDPARARELLAEAEDLAARAPVQQVPRLAELMAALLARARAKTEGTASPPDPLVGNRPEDRALAESGFPASAVLGMLRDERIPVYLRVMSGFKAAFAVATEPSRLDQALTYAETATELLADVTDRGADRRSAELALSAYARGLAPTFASVVLAIEHATRGPEEITRVPSGQGALPVEGPAEGPRVDRAAALLERSRGILLARMMEGHADLGDLLRVRPDLAREFERLTAQLAADPDALAKMRPDDHPPSVCREDWARLAKRRMSGEYDGLIARIREQAGFADFLLAPSPDRMRELAAEGPVVLLVHPSAQVLADVPKALAPQAVVVTTERITSLRLDAEPATVTDMAARMRDALEVINARGRHRPGPEQVIAASETFRAVLSWAWHTVVRPVLAVAGISAPVEGTWPRIWWVPAGPFNALPLHAAECTRPECDLGGCGAALDSVVSSYVPGFRSLAHVRAAAAMRRATPRSRGLLVGTPPAGWPRRGTDKVLTGADATREAVLAAVRDATHVHFGCHASSDPAEPSGSVLHLPSGQELPVLEICRTHPRSARLAFLAACGTSRTSQRLPDEAVHLSSAFLLAGFPEAVGTLWEIDSADADRFTAEFYASPLAPARALHDVIRKLRRDHPARPHAWASYVHAGT